MLSMATKKLKRSPEKGISRSVRFTAPEWAVVESAAREVDRPVATYIRKAALAMARGDAAREAR